MTHLVTIWRNDDTKQWHHRFVHQNSKELARQSEGVAKGSTAVRSACTAYGLGELAENVVTDHGIEYAPSARFDVLVFVYKPGKAPQGT